MGSLESAYQSLDNAKREERELITKRDRFAELYDILKPFCEDYKRYLNINEAIDEIKADRKREIFHIFIALAVYITVFGGMNLISMLIFHSGMITSTIGASIGSFSVCTHTFFKDIFKDNKQLKAIREVREALSGDEKYENQSLQKVLELVAEDRDMARDECYVMGGYIREYEKVLEAANKELAEEILTSSGIEATITLKSNMKVLAKRYEENKK